MDGIEGPLPHAPYDTDGEGTASERDETEKMEVQEWCKTFFSPSIAPYVQSSLRINAVFQSLRESSITPHLLLHCKYAQVQYCPLDTFIRKRVTFKRK